MFSKDRTLVIVDGVPITAKLENLASLDSIPEEAKIGHSLCPQINWR